MGKFLKSCWISYVKCLRIGCNLLKFELFVFGKKMVELGTLGCQLRSWSSGIYLHDPNGEEMHWGARSKISKIKVHPTVDGGGSGTWSFGLDSIVGRKGDIFRRNKTRNHVYKVKNVRSVNFGLRSTSVTVVDRGPAASGDGQRWRPAMANGGGNRLVTGAL